MSFTAMHWLSKKPCDIAAGVHVTQAEGEERELFAKQAAEDWENLLFQRTKELAPGGKMVVVHFCLDADGYHLGYTDKSAVCREVAEGIIGMRTWSNSSFLTALDEGKRSEAERQALVDELYQRYEDEVFQDPAVNHMDYVHHYIVMEKGKV
ncbi:SAM dependent carboxyl methyltransferase [Chloropicon primus]|uniref:SAM dependent carboxyl methyltransferase n=1 Tax=Chloropicon primus TaxID=1764295 RepID=A0A5B8MR38_9CHLO|nr:SAM dependent carboxyl methyltransferase [Chloropicon primus]UPR01313.1 SAM dependent carboxyl methyltransferase [Chloropicon primus]|eukprot:QDZ22095.1 SAM dependent carboxyl methyltransferase [Chloropicon primus]